MNLLNPLAGFIVGLLVGFTGVGGGALMTPLLVILFGVAPQTAIGTDLLFASITKSFGVMVHGTRGSSTRVDPAYVRIAIAVMLAAIGGKILVQM